MGGCCAEVNLTFKVGEDWKILATMHDSAGVAIDISAAAVKWTLALDSAVLTTLTIGNGITLVGGGTTGQCLITVTPAMQASLGIVPTFYSHECQVILSSGVVTDQFAGYLRARPSLFPV